MGVYGLVFKRNVAFRVRVQAFLNLVCTSYMGFVTFLTTFLGYFYILPLCVNPNSWMFLIHRMTVIYLFLSTIGNFCTCVFTDPSTNSDPIYPELIQRSEHNASPTSIKGKSRRRREANSENGNANGSTVENGCNLPWCLVCKCYVVKRTHHCYLCGKCVVRRDHHCFFMGVCIGRRNHKYFIFFLLFMGLGTMYALLMLARFLYLLYGIQFHGPQTFITLFAATAVTVIKGEMPTLGYCTAFVLLYISLFGTVLAFGFFFWQMMIVFRGQTTFEARRGKGKNKRGNFRDNLAEVFGSGSCLPLLVPFYDLVN